MHQFIALALLAAVSVAEVRLTTVDEQASVGVLQSWDSKAVTLQNSESAPTQTPIEQILRVEMNDDIRLTTAASGKQVQLVDGSWLGVSQYGVEGEVAKLSGTGLEAASDDELGVPLDAIQAVRLMPLGAESASVVTQWRDIRNLSPAGDLIVIRKPGSSSLNYVEGTLGDVGPDSVSFDLDGEDIHVNRNKVFGIVYYRNRDDESQPVARVEGANLRLSVLQAVLKVGGNQQALAVKTAHLGTLDLPIARVFLVDYSIDRLQYLSDLEPVDIKWTPAPGVVAMSPLLGGLARDRGLYAEQLLLEYPADSLPPELASSAGINERVSFAKGLAIRSRSELTYRVPRGFGSFRAIAGIDPRTQTTGEVELTLQGDGKPLWKQTIRGGDVPSEIYCNVADMRKLKIIVDYGAPAALGAGTGDNLHLAEARFTK